MTSQAVQVIGTPEAESEPDTSEILIESVVPTKFVTNFVVPLVYAHGMFIVPSVLLLMFVTIYFDDAKENS